MSPTTALRAVAVLGLLVAANGLVLSPMWLLDGAETFSETAASWEFATSQRISWLLLTLLVPVVPALAGGGTRSRMALVVQVDLTAQAATAFAMGFVAPWLAGVEPDLLDRSGGAFQVAMTAVWLLNIGVLVAFAIALARTPGAGRVGPVLLAVGALVVPGAGPVGWGLMGLGLAVVARRLLSATPQAEDRSGVVAAASGSA